MKSMKMRGICAAVTGALLFGFGVNGQHLFVDKKNQIVIAKFSSQAAAVDVGRLQTTLAWIDALRARIAS